MITLTAPSMWRSADVAGPATREDFICGQRGASRSARRIKMFAHGRHSFASHMQHRLGGLGAAMDQGS